MDENKMILIGEKESFITRVLVKKANDAGAECSFAYWNVNAINQNLEGLMLIVLFMDEGERPPEAVLFYLSDLMKERGIQVIIIAEQIDMPFVLDHLPGDQILKTFTRPVDNTVYMRTISDYMAKAAAGEFKKSILVVDDDPQYLTIVREWLKGTYKVSMANSGLQALKWLGKNRVDLILLDHEMPVTSGPQVLNMLRSDPETSSIPVIFLTGKRDRDSVMEVVSLKPEGYFLKGIEKEELLEKLQEFFTLHQ